MVKIPIHSVIDLITNSSTEIFINCKDSIEPTKELLNEFLKLIGSDKTCDEVFEISTEYDDDNIENFLEYWCEYDDEELYKELGFGMIKYDERLKVIKDFIKGIKEGRKEKPKWFDDGWHVQVHLVIKAKDEKYEKFVELLKKFLLSPEYYEYSTD